MEPSFQTIADPLNFSGDAVPPLDILTVFGDACRNMNYPGGKEAVFRNIVNLMPPHETYIEPFLGGGAVMRMKRAAVMNIGVDLDPKVIAMWQGCTGNNGEWRQSSQFHRYRRRNRQIRRAGPISPETALRDRHAPKLAMVDGNISISHR